MYKGKRIFDIIVALALMILFAPVYLTAVILVSSCSGFPVFYKQLRVGLGSRIFYLYKFRTMKPDSDKTGSITVLNDKRITKCGKFLRKYKIDELPQFFNVLRGDMSIVGPRPEMPLFVERNRNDFNEILKIKPGITDIASILFFDESEYFTDCSQAEADYLKYVLPRKIELSREYLKNATVINDLRLILKTCASIFR